MRFSDYLAELKQIKTLAREEEAALWRAYKEEHSAAARRRLILAYQPLVCREVLPFRDLPSVMDAVQEGTVGLIEAVERYEPARGVAFSLYAVHRVRGRILDFFRREGKCDLPALDAVPEDAALSLKDSIEDTRLLATEAQAERHVLSEKVQGAMGRLPEKERAVLAGVYLESQPAAAVAADLGVTASHVYRLEKQGIRRVRGMLSRFMQHW